MKQLVKLLSCRGGSDVNINLKPQFGWINIKSEFEGIDVLLDGNKIGKTPIKTVVVATGPHILEPKGECYNSVSEKIMVESGKAYDVVLGVHKKESAIKVLAKDESDNDIEADVYVDGIKIGSTPGIFKVFLCSKEALISSGFGVFKQKLELKEKDTITINAVLKKTISGGFQKNKGIVIDTKTGLMWQSQNGTGLNWKNAQKYCSDLEIQGYSDWRLPTISELKTLISGCSSGNYHCQVSDICLSYSKCWSDSCFCENKTGPGENGFYWPKGIFEYSGGSGWFWSSSLDSDSVWNIAFTNGSVYRKDSKRDKGDVRCVRK